MATETKTRYTEAVGRRKSAVARVRLTPGAKGTFVVNDKDVDSYFQTVELQNVARAALTKGAGEQKFSITVKVSGGGIHAQAEAVRHGISRVLVDRDEEVRATLKKLGFLKRDSRAKERKKFGLKKARKAPTWSKR